MSGLINFYETESIKKRLPKTKDEQYEYTGIKIRTRNLLCGGSGTGKTNAIMNFIYLSSQPKKGTFKHIYLLYKTDEPLYDDLIEKLGKSISVFKEIKDIPDVMEFADQPKYEVLFIFDDVVNEKKASDIKKIQDYYKIGRKKGITSFFLTQSYFQTDKFFRDNLNNILLLSIKSVKDLNRIIGEYEIPEVSQEQVQNMMRYSTTIPLNFMKITCDHVPIEQKFTRNFLEYLNPTDF